MVTGRSGLVFADSYLTDDRDCCPCKEGPALGSLQSFLGCNTGVGDRKQHMMDEGDSRSELVEFSLHGKALGMKLDGTEACNRACRNLAGREVQTNFCVPCSFPANTSLAVRLMEEFP